MTIADAIDLARRVRRDGPTLHQGRLWNWASNRLHGRVPRPFANLDSRRPAADSRHPEPEDGPR